jgi:hypothetical protein
VYKTASEGSDINLIDLSEESSSSSNTTDGEEGEGLYSAESEAERREKLKKIREALRQSHAQNIARYHRYSNICSVHMEGLKMIYLFRIRPFRIFLEKQANNQKYVYPYGLCFV